jgi:hypothetical protein
VGVGRGDGHPLAGSADVVAKKEDAKLIRLSVPEVRKLLLQVVWDFVIPEPHVFDWSRWRRRHQYYAKYYHYKRRNAAIPQTDLQL